MRSVRIAVLAAGEKGRAFLAGMISQLPATVVDVRTYTQAGTLDEADALIEKLCHQHGIRLAKGARPDGEFDPDIDLIFVVGWQYLLPADHRLVVFHDSLLPKFRGFAPTVAALIGGEREIGVTAIRPVGEPDAGPMLAQHSVTVSYPVKIRHVLEQLSECYLACARDIVSSLTAGALSETPQNSAEATYSIWRDEEDYLVDWSKDAATICRTIDALGWPYSAAKTRLGSTTLTIHDAVPGPDLRFENVQPGKIWSLAGGAPTVVCGTGTVTLTDVRDSRGTLYTFDRLRVRLT